MIVFADAFMPLVPWIRVLSKGGVATGWPQMVLQEYLENRRAGKIKKEDKFMVLCTQPRPRSGYPGHMFTCILVPCWTERLFELLVLNMFP